MKKMRLLDLGSLFGLPVAPVFLHTATEVIQPNNLAAAEEALPTVDLVGFGGGADIHPSLYGCKDVGSMVGHAPSQRDIYERRVFAHCVANSVPMFGICRGAQLVCALSGGKLIQDVEGHGGMHTMHLSEGGVLPMSSTHHQMMYPWQIPHELLAWTPNKSRIYTHDIPDYVQATVDPEVVYFPQTKALAVQGHPEWMDPKCPTVLKVKEWVNQRLAVNF